MSEGKKIHYTLGKIVYVGKEQTPKWVALCGEQVGFAWDPVSYKYGKRVKASVTLSPCSKCTELEFVMALTEL